MKNEWQNRWFLCYIILQCITLILISSSFAANWTFMVYLDADNNLEPDGIDDFLELAKVGSNDSINYLVQMDRIDGEADSYGDWKDCKRFRVTRDMIPTADNAQMQLGEVNMGDPNTLKEFISWSMTNYPAQNYALILWDHGDGWTRRRHLKKQDNLKGVCFDDTNDSDGLTMAELKQVLTNLSVKPSLVGFDACLMGMIENAYVLSQCGISVMVASEETEPAKGWPYDTIAQGLSNHSSWTASQLGAWVVDKYYESYDMDQTQAAIDLSKMNTLATAVSNLATGLRTLWQNDHETINNAAQAVRDRVQDAVINTKNGNNFKPAAGLSIYFPQSYYDDAYDQTDFAIHTTWNEFITDFHTEMSGTWISLARSIVLSFEDENYIDLDHFCELIQESQENQKPGYRFEKTAYSFEDIQQTGTCLHISDDSFAHITLSNFTVRYYDSEYHELSVGDNGVIYFINDDLSSSSNEYIPGSTKFNSIFIAPFWDDMMGATIYWEIKQTDMTKRLILQWHEVAHYDATENNPMTFQAILYETGQILFQYKDTIVGDETLDHGASATVGIQGSVYKGVLYSFNKPLIEDELSILFIPESDDTCYYSLSSCQQTIHAQGEERSIALTTDDACKWTVTTEVSWINILSDKTGTGPSQIKFSVPQNTQFGQRTGAIKIENSKITVIQESPCTYSISPSQTIISALGGAGEVSITTSLSGCLWEASSNHSWITIQSEKKGTGNAKIVYSVEKNPSQNKRTGTLTIAGKVFSIIQEAAEAPDALIIDNGTFIKNISLGLNDRLYYKINIPVNHYSLFIQTEGGTGDCDIYIKQGQMPTQDEFDYSSELSSNNEQIYISEPESGEWFVLLYAYSRFDGLSLKVSYSSQPCTYMLSQSSLSISSLHGSYSFQVNTGEDCIWVASTTESWIYITQDDAKQSGNGVVEFQVEVNPFFTSRTGYIQVNNQQVEIIQQGNENLSFTILENGLQKTNLSGQEKSYTFFKITVPDHDYEKLIISTWGGTGDCDLYIRYNNIPTIDDNDAESNNNENDESIQIDSPQTGDYYILLYGYEAFSDVFLRASLQERECTYTISETEIYMDSSGGKGQINIITGNLCEWFVLTENDWISIISSGSSIGNGIIEYAVSPNQNNLDRTGSIIMNDSIIFISQSGATHAISLVNNQTLSQLNLSKDNLLFFVIDVPNGQNNLMIDSFNGEGDVDLFVRYGTFPDFETHDYKCYAWGNDENIYIKNPDSGKWYILMYGFEDSSQVSLKATYNTLVCNYSVTPMDSSFDVNGDYGTLAVQVNEGCSWAAIKHGEWIEILEETRRGLGNGFISYFVPNNENSDIRTNNIRVADQWVTVRQAGTIHEQPISLSNNMSVYVNGKDDSTLYYMINVPQDQSELIFDLSGGVGDCDLYISHENFPTFRRFDYRPYLEGNDETVVIDNPSSGIWYVMLYAYSSFSNASLQITYSDHKNLIHVISILQILSGLKPSINDISMLLNEKVSMKDALSILYTLSCRTR